MSALGAAAHGASIGTAAAQDTYHSDDDESVDDKTGIDAWLEVLSSRGAPEQTQTVKISGSWSDLCDGVVVFKGVPKKLAASMGYSINGKECFTAVEALYLFDAGVLELHDKPESLAPMEPAAAYRLLLPEAGGASVYKAYCQLKDAGYILQVNRTFKVDSVPYKTPVPIPDAASCPAGRAPCPDSVLFEVFVRLRTDYARSRPGIPMARVVTVTADAETPVLSPQHQQQLLQACAVCDVCALEDFVASSKPKHKNALQGGAAAEFLLCILLNSHIPVQWHPRAAVALQQMLPTDWPPESLWDLVTSAWPITSAAAPQPSEDARKRSLEEELLRILAWTGEHLPAGDSQGCSVWHAVVDGSITVAFLKALPCTVPPGDLLLGDTCV